MSPTWTELNTASDLAAEYAPIIKGKTILTTGVTPGSIGAAFVEALAAVAEPSLLILAGRTPAKLEAEVAKISEKNATVKTKTVVVDLLSLDSVRAAAADVNGWTDVPHIDVVVNCAGIMAVPYTLSKDGFESQFAANHLSHFLLTNLIMDKILASVEPRIINVSSNGHRLSPVRWADLNFQVSLPVSSSMAIPDSQHRISNPQDGKNYEKWTAYGQSKTANMLMAVHLARILGSRGLLAFSLHPGVITSSGLSHHLDFTDAPDSDFAMLSEADQVLGNPEGFGKGIYMHTILSDAQGASTTVYASFEPSLRSRCFSTLQLCSEAGLLTLNRSQRLLSATKSGC